MQFVCMFCQPGFEKPLLSISNTPSKAPPLPAAYLASTDHKLSSRSPTKSMRPGIWSCFRTWLEIQKILHFRWLMEHLYDSLELGNTLLYKPSSRRVSDSHFLENLHSQNKHFSLPYGLGWRLTCFVISQGWMHLRDRALRNSIN